MIHAEANKAKQPEWEVTSDGKLVSHDCQQWCEDGQAACTKCTALQYSTRVHKIMATAKAEVHATTTNHQFLTGSQLIQRSDMHRHQRDSERLANLNTQRKLAILQRAVSMHKRIMVALSEQEVPRLHQLISVCIKRRSSLSHIYTTIVEAMAELYHPKGFDQEDHDVAILAWRLGGRQLLFMLQQKFGLMGIRSMYDLDRISFKVCLQGFDSATVQHNLQNMVKEGVRPRVLMVDEVAVEPTVRYDADTNKAVGFCWQHSTGLDLSIQGEDSVAELRKLCDANTMHIASEATVVALGALGDKDYSARIIMQLPHCKHGIHQQQKKLLTSLLKWYDEEGHKGVYGPVWCLSSDGANYRRAALHMVFESVMLSAQSPIYTTLSALPLLDLHVSAYQDITLECDHKHCMKRFREAIKDRETHVGATVVLVRDSHRQFLQLCDCEDVEALLNPKDAMNVPMAMRLCKALTEVSKLDAAQFTKSGQREQWEAEKLISQLCASFLSVFDHTASLQEQLITLSKMGHMLAFLYSGTGQRGKFLQSVLYHDMQANVKNAYFCTAKAQQAFPDLPLYLFQLGDNALEETFSLLRTLHHASNFDMLQLGQNTSILGQVQDVYDRNPKWHKQRKHLTPGDDRDRPYAVEAAGGDRSVQGINLQHCWAAGRAAAIQALDSSGLFEQAEPEAWFEDLEIRAMEAGDNTISLLQPDGKPEGVGSKHLNQVAEDDHKAEGNAEGQAADEELEEQLDVEQTAGQKTAWVEIDKQQVHKSTLMKEKFSRQQVSGDRVTRVRGQSRWGPGANADQQRGQVIGEDENVVVVGDEVAVWVRCGGRDALAIARVSMIKVIDAPKDSANRYSLPARDAISMQVTMQCQVLQLRQRSGPQNLAEAAWEWDGNYLGSVEIPGLLAVPINPPLCCANPAKCYLQDCMHAAAG